MMRICLPLLLLWTWIIGSAAAQGPVTSKAIEQARNGKVDAAATTIEDATLGLEGDDPMTWYVKAFIHKTLYVERDGRAAGSQARDVAVGAVLRCHELDGSGRLAERRMPLLTFLAETHLEDARDAIRTSRPGDARAAQRHFEQYTLLQSAADSEWNPTPDAVLLDQQLAEFAFAQAESEERSAAGPWFDWGVTRYEAAASAGHDEFRSRYNLAVHTYNQGVRQFKAAEDDLDAIDGALQDAAVLWRAAASQLELAIPIDPKRSKGYEALAIVSEALLNQDRIEWCKANLLEMGSR